MADDHEIRFRGTAGKGIQESDDGSLVRKSDDESNQIYSKIHLFSICITLTLLSFAVWYSGQYLPVSKPVDTSLIEFSGDRARKHLDAVTSLGPRPAGSHASDVLAVKYLLEKLNSIKETADPRYLIEIELQRASGSFAFFRKTKFMETIGMTSAYDNTTNVIVKLSPRQSTTRFVLANVHFDTVPNTEGASDDAVNCAVLIEIYRAMSKLDPAEIKHGIIFLFNGAEEGGLSGSHAFLQHRWFPLVNVVVNLEAAGSGGQEFVFQTGPGHPWILDMYASTAKYPFTSVMAQEVFHSGIIPSDTDYRVFVQYGNLVGVDIAFVKNGYVYHTRYDDAKSIPSGSIQRAGDNVLGLIKGITNSSYLDNPEKFKHGSSIFFDVLGLFIVHYPKRLHILMNWITCAAVLLYLLRLLHRQKKLSSAREHAGSRHLSNSTVTLSSLFFSIIVILFSWILAFVVALSFAALLTKLKILMVWYSYPKFALFLYGLPSLFGMLLGHYIGNKLLQRFSHVSTLSFICGHLVIHTAVLFYANQHEVSSSFILWLWIIFPFFFICAILDFVSFQPETKDRAIFLLHIVATIPPILISMYHLDMLFTFFGPLQGRMGDIFPSDIVIASLSAFSIIVVFSYFMNLFHSARSKLQVLILVGFSSLVLFSYVLTGNLQPYSAKDPITPKRLYMIHMLRKFHNSDGSVQRQDSGVWIQPVDALAFSPLAKIEHFKNAESFECDGSFCGLPYYYPTKRKIFRKSWYLRGEKPESITNIALTTDIYKRVVQDDGSIKFYFDIEGPDHMVLFLTLKPDVQLDWSLYKSSDGHIYKTSDYIGGYSYLVFYTHGYYQSSWTFWMHFRKSAPGGDLAELGIARHYLHGKHARTRFLNDTIDALPGWVHDSSWCSNYDSFTLA